MYFLSLQKKNPLMKHIRNVPWEVGNIVPDFELGKTTCALFLRYVQKNNYKGFLFVTERNKTMCFDL